MWPILCQEGDAAAPVHCGRGYSHVDPVTHALVGAAFARVAASRPLGRGAWLPGAVGALLPDADVLIRSAADPLLYAEFHRHFTHALAFIPVGGSVAALPWLLRARHRRQWQGYVLAATAGYATHGVLDAATTYGTSLWWPFSETRVAWNLISIVDPVFTLVVLTGVAVAVRRRSAVPAAVALCLCAVYLGLGAVQQARARDAQEQIALSRGHAAVRAAVFPGFANNVIWRSLYQEGQTIHSDRLRVPWWGASSWHPGYAADAVGERDLDASVLADARLRRDFRRFSRFTHDWVARAALEPDILGDARYSSSDERFTPVWGIRFAPNAPVPIEWVDRSGQRRVDPGALWRELIGRDP